MQTYSYPESQALFQRASRVMPCGIYGHFSPAPLIPPEYYPFFTAKAKGARFFDIDGNEFIDYMCGYGPMVTGYNNPEVDAAALDQLKRGNCTTSAAPVMVELAEYLVDLVPAADWAFFAKNGGDITNYATMIARDATGRSKIVMFKGGYHGVAAWMQSPGHHGVTDQDHEHILRVDWNDFAALEAVVQQHGDDIAGLIATPYHVPTFADSEMPAEGFWQKVEALCRKHGIVLIIDDIRHGFRLDMGGSCEHFGFKPDLICFCKALANGYPISALVGSAALKDVTARVFCTGSYWFSAVPMAAALANLKLMKAMNAPRIMLETGDKLLTAMVDIAKTYGFDLKVTGAPSMPYLRITNDPSLMLHQQWCAECTRRGAYFTSHHNWFVSTAHTDDDIRQTLDIVDDAFKAVRKTFGDRF
ncbi:aminotransferase class III-fold pyridoxal phosphate-dependent enzyme [uncultured Desulfosarcina sp.]|uniref:aminotransferase class III-fold pyridoxal phosphate-dependent enzyme n=1 Tax=uncultured Desulfosarcina sp. TaxID=218289 RepID=UPI0029C8D225|nr:aminotransferase class III-fold pyridoxal phosphate-dependent enzyme [uncultured Desulfosarcina sp.]